jgi:hypothetical protein
MCKAVDFNRTQSLPPVDHGPHSSSLRRIVSFMSILTMLMMPLLAVPEVSSMMLFDTDGNGEADQLDIFFSGPVDISDGDLGNGLPGIEVVVDDNGSAPYFKSPRRLEIAPGDYGATGVSSLSLTLVEVGILDTGMSVYIEAKEGTGFDIIDPNDGQTFSQGYISSFSQDNMGPVLIGAYTVEPEAGEMTLLFSEPVQRMGGNLNLLVADFNYNDLSSGNVSSISAMGADTDGSDGRVSVLVNTMISPSDLGADMISPLSSIEDMFGNGAQVGTPAGLELETGSGAAIEISLVDHAHELMVAGTNLQYLGTLELISIQGGANLQILPLTAFGIPSAELNLFQFFDDSGMPVSSPFSLGDGVEDVVDLNIPVGDMPQLIHLASGVFGVPASGNVTISINTAGVSTDLGANGGAGSVDFMASVFDPSQGTGGGGMGSFPMGPRDEAYGMTPADGGIERVIIEYSYLKDFGFSFYAEVIGDLTNVSSIELSSPGGEVVSFIYENDFYWSGEAPVNDTFYASQSELDALYGAGSYSIDITYMDTSTETLTFSANPTISETSPEILAPLANDEIEVPFSLGWSALAGADFYEAELEAPNMETRMHEPSYTFAGNVTSVLVEDPLDEGVGYELFVAGVTVVSASNVMSSAGDEVSVIVQAWQEDLIPVSTKGPGRLANASVEFGVGGPGEHFFAISVETYGEVAGVDFVVGMDSYSLISGATPGTYSMKTMDGDFASFGDLISSFPSGPAQIMVAPFPSGNAAVYDITLSSPGADNTPTILTPGEGSVVGSSFPVELSPLGTGLQQEFYVSEEFGDSSFLSLAPDMTSINVPGPLSAGNVELAYYNIQELGQVNLVGQEGDSFDFSQSYTRFEKIEVAVGALFVGYDPGFSPDRLIPDGASGAEVLGLTLSSSNTVTLNEMFVEVTRADAGDVSLDISSATLTLTDSNGVMDSFSGVVNSSNIEFSFAGHVVDDETVLGTLSVDLVAFPEPGGVNFSVRPINVGVNEGPSFGDGVISEGFTLSTAGFVSSVVKDLSYEVGPGEIPASASTNLSVILSSGFRPSQNGFNTVIVGVPSVFDNANVLSVSTGASNTTLLSSYSDLLFGSDYSVNVMAGGFEIFLANSVNFSSANKLMKVELGVVTNNIEINGAEFSVGVRNTSAPEAPSFADSSSLVSLDLDNNINSPNKVDIFVATSTSVPPVSELFAEVDTVPNTLFSADDTVFNGVEAESLVEFRFAVRAEVLAGDPGFDLVAIQVPSVFEIDFDTIAVTNSAGSPLGIAGNNIFGERLVVQLDSLLNTTGPNYLYLNFSANTMGLNQGVEFMVDVMNSADQNAYPASEGPAELDPSDPMKWNLLSVPFLEDTSLPEGDAVSALFAEVESENSNLNTNDVEEITILIETEVFGGLPGFDYLEVILPAGLAFEGLPTFEDSVETTYSFTSFTGGKATIELGSAQASGNMKIYANVSTPIQEVDGEVAVMVGKVGLANSEKFAEPKDVDEDGLGTDLFVSVVAPISTIPNITGSLVYEVDVADSFDGTDLGSVTGGRNPFWRVYVRPQLQTGDAGFDLLKISLQSGLLGPSQVAGVRVFSVNSANAADLSSWPNSELIGSANLLNVTPQANGVEVQLSSARSGAALDEVLIVTFQKRVPESAGSIGVIVELNKSNNINFPRNGNKGNADGDLSDRNAAGFTVNGAEPEPILTNATAEIITDGVPVSGNTFDFSVYLDLEFSPNDLGVKTINLVYPDYVTNVQEGLTAVDLKGVYRASGNATLDSSELPSAAYATHDSSQDDDLELAYKFKESADGTSVELEGYPIEFVNSTNVSRLIRLDFSARAPEPMAFLDFEVVLDNSAGSPLPALSGNVVKTDQGDDLSITVESSEDLDTLKDVVQLATAEAIIALPSDAGARTFLQAGDEAQVSLLLKVDVNEFDPQGFRSITISAPGVEFGPAFSVYRSSTDDLGLSDSEGPIELELENIVSEGSTAVLVLSSLQASSSLETTIFYRVDFTPSFSSVTPNDFFEVILRNQSANEVGVLSGNVGASSLVFGAGNVVLERNNLAYSVKQPPARGPVSQLLAEINVLDEEGNKVGDLEMNTRGTFVLDFRPFFSSTESLSGFDIVELQVPDGFGAPTFKTLKEFTSEGTFVGNVSFTESNDLVGVDLVDGVIDSNPVSVSGIPNYYELVFESTGLPYSDPISEFKIRVDNSSESKGERAEAKDVDGLVNTNGLELYFSPPAELQNSTPLVNLLSIEVSPGSATISTSEALSVTNYSIYVFANNTSGQRGFDELTVDLPDFISVNTPRVFKTDGAGGFTALSEEPIWDGENQKLSVDFTSVLGVNADEIVKITFAGQNPLTSGAFDFTAKVDLEGKGLDLPAIAGNATTEIDTDGAKIFFDPPENDDVLLTSLRAAALAGSAVDSEDELTGRARVGDEIYVDLVVSALKSTGEIGIDQLLIDVPFSIEGTKLLTDFVTMDSVLKSTYESLGATSWEEISSANLVVTKFTKAGKLGLEFGDESEVELQNGQERLFRVRMPIVIDDALDLGQTFRFRVEAFSSDSSGVSALPSIGVDVTGASSRRMEVEVFPKLIAQDDIGKTPVSVFLAELGPNLVPTGELAALTIAANMTIEPSSLGFDAISIQLPAGFGEPSVSTFSFGGDVSANLLDLQINEFQVFAEEGKVLIQLNDLSVDPRSTSYEVTLEINVSVLASSAPIVGQVVNLEVIGSDAVSIAGWGEVRSDVGAIARPGSLRLNTYTDFSQIVKKDPVEDLYGEVDIRGVSNAKVFAGDLMTVTTYINALNTNGTAGGFDLLVFKMDPLMNNFPEDIEVKVVDSTGNLVALAPGTSTGYTVDVTNPERPRVVFSSIYSSDNVEMVVTYEMTAPSQSSVYDMDFYVDNQNVPVSVHPSYGVVDLDGEPNDGNSLSARILPAPIVVDESFYVVDSVVAEVVGENLDVSTSGELTLSVNVANVSGNGFNSLTFDFDEQANFTGMKTFRDVQSNTFYVENENVFLTPRTGAITLSFSENVLSSGLYELEFSLTAPSFPKDLRFDVEVDNDNLSNPVIAIEGDANGVLDDHDDLTIGVYAVIDGDKTNLESLTSEVAFTGGAAKTAIVNEVKTIRAFIRPEFSLPSGNNGIDLISLTVPTAFGQPYNVKVSTGNLYVLAGSSSLTELTGGFDYFLNENSPFNQIEIDFSSSLTALSHIDYNNTASENLYFVVDFDAVMPEADDTYTINVVATNSAQPVPAKSRGGDVNGNADDDGNGTDNGLNDNNNNILVQPAPQSSEALATIDNAELVLVELTGPTSGALGSSLEISMAANVLMSQSGGNVNRLKLILPTGFENIKGFEISSQGSGESEGTKLQEVTDYTVNLEDPKKILVSLENAYVTDVLFTFGFTVTLPGVSREVAFALSVDNTLEPKKVDATGGDAVSFSSSDSMIFFVDQPEFNDDDLVKTMLTSLTASANIEGDRLEVNHTGVVSLELNADFGASDEGFDYLEIFSAGLNEFQSFEVEKLVGGVSELLFAEEGDYTLSETETGVILTFSETVSSNATFNFNFVVMAGTLPQSAQVGVIAYNFSLPFSKPALLAEGGTLTVEVVPAQASPEELKERRPKPVSSLLFDVTPTSGNVGSSQMLEIYVNATALPSDNLGTGANVETIPANSGFDQVFVDLPKKFGAPSGLEIYRYDNDTFAGEGNLLQENSSFLWDADSENRIIITLLASANLMPDDTGVPRYANFKVVLNTKLSGRAVYGLGVSVDNSIPSKSNKVFGVKGEFSGDQFANDQIVAVPRGRSAEEELLAVATAAFATVVYPQTTGGENDLPFPGQEPYAYTIRVQANAGDATVGFDSLDIGLPSRFRNVSVTSVTRIAEDDTETNVPQGTRGYVSGVDEADSLLSLEFTELQALESGNTTFKYMDIGLVAKMPFIEATYQHTVELSNSAEEISLTAVRSKINPEDSGETGKLAVEVAPWSTSNKYGFFGGGSGNILANFKGAVFAWDEEEDAFASTITQTTTARNILVQTEPEFSTENGDGFDYMQIDLPYGAGEPSNVVVFFQAASGNYVYLQEFYDYQVFSTPGDLTIEFSDVVNETYMSSSTEGVFTKIGETEVAEKLLVSFEMEMPNRLGSQFFDVFVLNTDVNNVVSDPFFIDPLVGEDRDGVQLLGAVSTVTRNEALDGTRFLTLTVEAAASAVAVVESVVSEIVAIGQEFIPPAASRQMRLDVSVENGSGNSFNFIEIQLPEGFSTVASLVLNEGGETLTEFIDYTLDMEHPRGVGISLSSDRASSTAFDMTFTIQTPVAPPQVEVTYTFGVVVSDQKSGLLTTVPVFAIAGDASALNSGSLKSVGALGVVLKDGAVISGTLVLGELPLGTVTGTLTLEKTDLSSTYMESFTLTPSEGSYRFVISQTSNSASATFGVENGSYNFKVSLPQYSNYVSSSPIVISGGTSAEGLVIDLVPEDVQGTLSLSSVGVSPGGSASVNLNLEFLVSDGVSASAYEFEFVADGEVTGDFSEILVSSVSMGGVAVDLSRVSDANGLYTVNLSGLALTSPLQVSLEVTAQATQTGFYSVNNTLVTSAGNFLGSNASVIGSAPQFNVGEAIRILLGELPRGLLDGQYSFALNNEAYLFVDESQVSRGDLVFTWTISSQISSTLEGTTGGVLQGTFDLASEDGFSVSVTVSGGGASATKEFALPVFREPLYLSSITPAVLPTSGGEFVIKGTGFTASSTVYVGSTVISGVIRNDQTELLVSLPAIEVGTYGVTVEDGSDFAGLPNPLNSSSLLVAASEVISEVVEPSVAGETASIRDYDIVGLKGFYQGSVREILEGAYGTYDPTAWRVFGYDQGYFELDAFAIGSDGAKLRPGSAFWKISRVGGSVSMNAVPSGNIPSYTVEVAAGSWALISNVYDQAVEWTSVTILAGTTDVPVIRTVSADRLAVDPILNANLYAMNKEAEDLSRPYQAADALEPGTGYWVQNKSSSSILLKIANPGSGLNKVRGKAGEPYFKAGEDVPPEAPVSFSKSGATSSAAGGGGGCLLR